MTGGVPLPATPAFLTDGRSRNQLALSSIGVLWGIDPNIKSPHVHQVSVGIQRDCRGRSAVEARYVGTFGRGIWRGIDYNQIRSAERVPRRLQPRAVERFLAQQAGLAFSPAFNPDVPGSQPLTVLHTLGLADQRHGGHQHSARTQLGGLADFYITQTRRRPGRSRSVPARTPGIYASQGDHQRRLQRLQRAAARAAPPVPQRLLRPGELHALATRRPIRRAPAQNRFEAFMDNNRPELNTGRSIFHVTHVMNANAIYELPVRRGPPLAESAAGSPNRAARRLAGRHRS